MGQREGAERRITRAAVLKQGEKTRPPGESAGTYLDRATHVSLCGKGLTSMVRASQDMRRGPRKDVVSFWLCVGTPRQDRPIDTRPVPVRQSHHVDMRASIDLHNAPAPAGQLHRDDR